MTAYIFTIGYQPTFSGNEEDYWNRLVAYVQDVCADSDGIKGEAMAGGCPKLCSECGESLDDFCEAYEEPLGSEGHPVRIEEEDRRVVQSASGGCELKYPVRRAFVRELIRQAHSNGLEVNVEVV